MRTQDTIERKLAERFAPVHLEVVNESGNHNVPRGSETHFKVVLVAPAFEGLRPLARHRLVNATLAEQLAGGVHALAIHTYTEPEWRARFGAAPLSPPCLGGSAAESQPSAAKESGVQVASAQDANAREPIALEPIAPEVRGTRP